MQTIEFTKEALERSTKAVTLRPSRGQYTHKNTAVIAEGTSCFVEEKKFQMMVDVPPSIGGAGAGPTPGALMRSALTSCLAIGVKLWAARVDIEIDHICVTLEGDVDARGELGVDDAIAPGYEGLRIRYAIKSKAPKDEIEAVIDRSLKYSPLYDVFTHQQKLDVMLELEGAAQDTKPGEQNYA